MAPLCRSAALASSPVRGRGTKRKGPRESGPAMNFISHLSHVNTLSRVCGTEHEKQAKAAKYYSTSKKRK